MKMHGRESQGEHHEDIASARDRRRSRSANTDRRGGDDYQARTQNDSQANGNSASSDKRR
jgi:hypothetical protein